MQELWCWKGTFYTFLWMNTVEQALPLQWTCLKVSKQQMRHTVHLFLLLMVATLCLLRVQKLPASELFYGLTSSLVLNFSLLISPSLLWIIPPSGKLCQQKLALEIPRVAIPHLSYQNSKLSYEYFATVVPQDPWCLFVMLFQVSEN